MARPHALADPEFALQVAELLSSGATRQEICDALGVDDRSTITRWKRDPRVQVHVKRLIAERVYNITRKTDAQIIQRLMTPQDLTVKELLAIRAEFLAGMLREETEKVDDQTINEAADLLDSDPTAMDEIRALLSRSTAKPADKPDG